MPRPSNQTNWNRKQAAALLKISYKHCCIKIRHYRLERQARENCRPALRSHHPNLHLII